MKIENCPYCKGKLKIGKLVYRFEFRTPKIIFDDGTEIKVNTFNPFKHAVINKVLYCESCQVMVADLSSDSPQAIK